MSGSLAAIWIHLPFALSLGFIELMLFGFWRGLWIKPRPLHERAPERWQLTGDAARLRPLRISPVSQAALSPRLARPK
jgi:hypothetical protein